MPLDPFRYSQPIVDVYAACVDELLINLARHFNVKGTGNSGSFSYQTRMLAKMGAINRESSAIIAKHVKENEPMILLAIEQAMLEAVAEEEPQLLQAARLGLLHDANIPVQESIQKQLTAYSRQAREQLNLVNTVMLEGTWKAYQDGVYQAANILKQMDIAQTALNAETGKVITGVSTRQQAVRSAVKKMAEVGITGFIDNGGHKWSPEAYVQMDIKTTCSNAARQAVFDRNRDYGNDLVWVRINATARPKCHPWQGKVISTEGRSGSTTDLGGREILFHSIHDTSYGEPDGLWGINCHHGPPNVFIPGLSSIHGSVPDPDDNAAAYALTQQQRKLERDVRAAKREAAMLDAAGDKEGFEKAALRLKQRQQTLKDFAEENNLYLRSDRTQVHGYGRSQAAKVTAAAKTVAKRAEWDIAFEQQHLATSAKEKLPAYRSAQNVAEKLTSYVLNDQHPRGKHKAIVFRSALGYNIGDAEILHTRIMEGLQKYRAQSTGHNGYGEQYRVTMLIEGIGDKANTKQPVDTGWIIRDGESFPRMVNAIVSDDRRP